MTRHDFENRLKILWSLDVPDLVAAGVLESAADWKAFRTDPGRWMIKADDARADRLWRLVEARCGRKLERKLERP